MLLYAFDLGVRTGLAVCAEGKITESGTMDFDLKRGESSGIRFLRFRRWVEGLACPLETVFAYEIPHLRGGHATDLLVGFSTRLQEIAAERGIDCMGVHTATLKKWATESGKASKADMISRACRIAGKLIADDNEADAVCVAAWAWEEVGRRGYHPTWVGH